MNNIFLTGNIRIGKSTLLKKILREIQEPIGGFIEEKIVEEDKTLHNMISLYNGNSNNIIAACYNEGRKPDIFNEVFEKNAVEILKKSYEERNIIVMDELGFLESKCEAFKCAVKEILDSSKIVIGVLKKCDCEFVNSISNRNDVTLIYVTKENRDDLKEKLLSILKAFNVKLKDSRCSNG